MVTTIQITEETKELISTFGTKKDSYNDIVRRLYQIAIKEQLREFLLSTEKAIPIDEAIKRAKYKWQR